MRAHTDRLWEQSDEAFRHADRAFAAADKAFAEADRLFREMPAGHSVKENGKTHTVHFNTHSKTERWRLFRKFARMACAVLFRGKTELQFKQRTEHES